MVPSRFAFKVPTVPPKVFVDSDASGIIMNLPSVSSKPINAIFAPLELYFILIPRSRLSSELLSPISKIGSATLTVVLFTVVVVPDTVRFPVTVNA